MKVDIVKGGGREPPPPLPAWANFSIMMECTQKKEPLPLCVLCGGVYSIEIDTLELHQTEKIETEVNDVDRIRKHTGIRRLSRVSFWGIPFSQYHILVHPCQQTPLKKGNSQMESSVQDNPAAPSPCQYG
jgi:hypothetical protein